jgi:hypothetical protein
MLVTDRDTAVYMRAAYRATLLGEPFETLADWAARTIAEEAAAKVVSFADMRAKLRPDHDHRGALTCPLLQD